jgi:hypothetical protein
MKKPTNVQVSLRDISSKTASASWTMDGARFHVWFNIDTLEIDGDYPRRYPVIYKNPPLRMDRNDPEFFDTRKLDATAAANAGIIEIVFAEIEKKDLISVARKDAEMREAQRQAESKAAIRRGRMEEAGPDLYNDLASMVLAFENYAKTPAQQSCIRVAKERLSKINGSVTTD